MTGRKLKNPPFGGEFFRSGKKSYALFALDFFAFFFFAAILF